MMKHLYLDIFAGVSGDMLLGLLVDLGLEPARLSEGLAALELPGLTVRARTALRGAIGGTKVDLECPDQAHDRHLSEIREIIQRSGLSDTVKARSIAVFTRLAEAEARVHRMEVEEVHFHEVGALDAIGDIVGVVLGLELLGVTEVFASALPQGKGFVESAHGRIPLPAPAVLELARGYPCTQLDIHAELTTPTGAALVTTLARAVDEMPRMTIERVGYGLGTRELPIPNAVRGVLGVASDVGADRVLLMEANIDDLAPTVLGYVCEKLLAAGALDVWMTPIQMKKGRPATQLSVLAEPSQRDALAALVFRETTTLGVRMATMERQVLPRRIVQVDTRFGPMRVKVAGGHVAPEYDDCARAAAEHQVPLRDVLEEVRARAAREV
jgi:uncharacterized protein (TIGR00299 family) protein